MWVRCPLPGRNLFVGHPACARRRRAALRKPCAAKPFSPASSHQVANHQPKPARCNIAWLQQRRRQLLRRRKLDRPELAEIDPHRPAAGMARAASAAMARAISCWNDKTSGASGVVKWSSPASSRACVTKLIRLPDPSCRLSRHPSKPATRRRATSSRRPRDTPGSCRQ
jgi:hypothetical protein